MYRWYRWYRWGSKPQKKKKKTQKVVKVAWGFEAEAGSVQTACPGDLHGNKPGDLRSKWLGGLKPKPDLCRVLAPAASGVATPAAPDT